MHDTQHRKPDILQQAPRIARYVSWSEAGGDSAAHFSVSVCAADVHKTHRRPEQALESCRREDVEEAPGKDRRAREAVQGSYNLKVGVTSGGESVGS